MNVTLHTNHGDINVTLFPDHAPKTVAQLRRPGHGRARSTRTTPAAPARPPFYDGLTFHRIIPGFMIQGGCPLGTRHRAARATRSTTRSAPTWTSTSPTCSPWPTPASAMGKGTNGSQFFITVGPDDLRLQGKHTIFGEVADGPSRDVVDAIAAVPTGRNDTPVERVVIERVTVSE